MYIELEDAILRWAVRVRANSEITCPVVGKEILLWADRIEINRKGEPMEQSVVARAKKVLQTEKGGEKTRLFMQSVVDSFEEKKSLTARQFATLRHAVNNAENTRGLVG